MASEVSDAKTPMPPGLPPSPAKAPLLPLPSPPAGDLQKVSLYVGDLDPQVTEADLVETFRFMGPLASVRLCRDSHSGESLRYAYVNYYSNSHASKAMACLNHNVLKGKAMRIMWSQRDPLPRKTGIGNVFVKNLDTSITSTHLQDIFGKFGAILSCKVAEENGKSKGFGFVQFDKEDSAVAAVSALNDTIIKGKKLYVSKFLKKSERPAHDEPEFTNLYVKNLDEDVTEELLGNKFSQYGRVHNLAIMKDDKGKSRGFGFVNFESQEEAKKAVEAMNGAQLGSQYLFVGRAQKKAEREKLLKCKKERPDIQIEKLKSSNLYVKNLAEYVDDRKLEERFSTFGKIVSVKVMRYDNGMSKGFGFVCFSTPAQATKALNALNGTILDGRELYVAVAQSREDRFRDLQDYYTHPLSSTVFQHPNWPVVHPVQYSVPITPPLSPLLNQAVRYPFVPQMNPHQLSWVPRQTQWGSTRNENFQNDSRTYAKPNAQTQDMNSGNHGGHHEGGFRKKGYNKQSGGTSTGTSHSMTTSRDRCQTFIENLQPGHSTESGMVLKMNNSEKGTQVLKAANSRTSSSSADHRPVFPKCGRYLI